MAVMANNRDAQLELANTRSAQLEGALSPPPWFGPHAILKEVEWLVVNDNNNAARGWLRQEIRDSLMRTHRQQQEELPRDFDAKLEAALASLLQMGDLKLVGVSVEEHYTLSPPYLPPWFSPEAVLKAVEVLNNGGNNAAGGSTWEQIRDFLRQKHQQDQPLPPDFDTVLRTMLSLLHQKGHLTTITIGSANNGGLRHYTRQHAPALVEHNTIDIPGYLWCYYLGYKLGTGGGLDDSDSGDEEEEHALMAKANNPNAPPWFGPRTVLQEVEGLALGNLEQAYYEGWTCQEIGVSLMQTHLPELDLPQGFDLEATLRATLATLSKRGYLTLKATEVIFGPRYSLSLKPPLFPCPPWFRPEAVLQAVGVIDDDNNNDNGTSSGGIRGYFMAGHDQSHTPWFDGLVRTVLSVLRQRGHLRRGASDDPECYTRRDAPAGTVGIPPNDCLLGYYAGYKLAGRHSVGLGEAAKDGLRQRRNISAAAETKPLPPTSKSSAADPNVGLPKRDEEANKEKKRSQQRLWYMIWRVCLSFIGHGILFGLTYIPGFGEETSGHHEEKTFIKWLKWAAMDVIVPFLVLIGMLIKQYSFDLDLEDDTSQKMPEDKKCLKTNKVVNLATLAVSKLFYVAIKEAPGPKDTLLISAHVVAFVIDMVGAIYLCWKHSGLDQEMPEFTWKKDI